MNDKPQSAFRQRLNKTIACVFGKNTMIVTTKAQVHDLTFFMAGSDTLNIDWGDGSAIETHTLSVFYDDWYQERSAFMYGHNFSGDCSRIITITGKNITHLYYTVFALTSLNVSKNTALTEL